ncbi:MAG: tRNA epoxyqueuosine(34) reductase QueG [bacterium]
MKSEIITTAKALGFALVGITTAKPVSEVGRLRGAIDGGRIGAMAWLGRNPEARCDPQSLLPGAKSVICCALAYGERGIEMNHSPLLCKEGEGEVDQDLPHPDPPLTKGRGNHSLARFARGADYHTVVREKLEQLWQVIKERAPEARAKLCVDSSPIMEKALAARAGLGWIGRHTILVSRDIGSWFVLGEIVTDLELPPDQPVQDLCGDCRACINACPTKALVAPHSLDARRCISYLTIEGKGPVSDELARFIPEGAYGCDLCQEACPYNHCIEITER